MPVIAMCTSTSFHPSILLLKKFAVESGLRRPFFSTSFWKSCAYFDSQFIAKGWLETEQYAACCERKWAFNNNKALLYWRVHVTKQTLVLLRTSSRPEEEFWVAIAAFEIYGWEFKGYRIFIGSFSSCWPNFLKSLLFPCLLEVDHVIKLLQKANIHNLTIIALVWDWLSPA